MMHYNMVHARIVEREDETIRLVFEEPDWYRADIEQLEDLMKAYSDIGFDCWTANALDDTVLVVLHSETDGWRVVQTRG